MSRIIKTTTSKHTHFKLFAEFLLNQFIVDIYLIYFIIKILCFLSLFSYSIKFYFTHNITINLGGQKNIDECSDLVQVPNTIASHTIYTLYLN